MASATRRRNHRYIGAPWPHGGVSQKSTKMERTKQSKPKMESTGFGGRHHVLPLVIKPNGRWAYKHGKLARQLKRARR